MSLPPEFIQVKRLKNKRKADDDTDEGVVDYLRVDGDRKRHRSGAFIYQRRLQQAIDLERRAAREAAHQTPRDSFPVIHATKPGDENRSGDKIQLPQNHAWLDVEAIAPAEPRHEATKGQPSTSTGVGTAPKSAVAPQPRRFHLSRVSFAPAPLFDPNTATGKRSRFNTPTTVFVERGHKRTKTEDVPMADAGVAPVAEEVRSSEPPRKNKLPGSGRKPADGSPGKPVSVKKDVPESMKTVQTEEMDQLARDMNDFVLKQIGENLAAIEERDRKQAEVAARRVPSVMSSQSAKFKPKAPTRRYAERHPEVADTPEETAPAAPTTDEMDVEYESLSEDEYVIETYVRVPATTLGEDVDPEKIGLLVFDNEPDVDYFYGVEGDSDDEWPEDDEDENAENYYTADYPDDEVDSDDEYDLHAYDYRNGNASDLEEYDERDDGYVLDEEGDDKAVPFSARFAVHPPAAFRGL